MQTEFLPPQQTWLLLLGADNMLCVYIHTQGSAQPRGLRGRLPSLTHCAAFCLYDKPDL